VDFAGAARCQAPEGWQSEKAESQADPALRFSHDSDLIKIRLFGGKGSRYQGPADYLRGFEATSLGKPPQRLRQSQVAGTTVWVYRHSYPLSAGAPGFVDPRSPALASEEFCIMPLGKRFFVLSWAHESPIPDPKSLGGKAWQEFLSSFAYIKGERVGRILPRPE
jgi:hypothetical protein